MTTLSDLPLSELAGPSDTSNSNDRESKILRKVTFTETLVGQVRKIRTRGLILKCDSRMVEACRLLEAHLGLIQGDRLEAVSNKYEEALNRRVSMDDKTISHYERYHLAMRYTRASLHALDLIQTASQQAREDAVIAQMKQQKKDAGSSLSSPSRAEAGPNAHRNGSTKQPTSSKDTPDPISPKSPWRSWAPGISNGGMRKDAPGYQPLQSDLDDEAYGRRTSALAYKRR